MTKKHQEFTGKDVAEAIARACEQLGAAQEELQIEVLATGNQGIFGLCKKKARIRVRMQDGRGEGGRQRGRQAEALPPAEVPSASSSELEGADVPELEPAPEQSEEQPPQIEAALLEQVRGDMRRMLELMGTPSEVEVSVDRETILCRIEGEYVAELIGPEGRILDSLQYVQRKMLGTLLPERAVLSLDAGNYRENRLLELRQRALDLAAEVRRSGRNATLPALSPAERRIVHMTLREEAQIKSRSIGDGPFKKVLISGPGGGRDPRPGRDEDKNLPPRRPRSRGRRDGKPPAGE
ncbi:MAG: hypothetical protein BWK76_24760 [Desulfobulbaceae bacterium A2]|nr:MAG: hypothetical protein BWK76_24760 [Desulfobulbaceae bacterium A2]